MTKTMKSKPNKNVILPYQGVFYLIFLRDAPNSMQFKNRRHEELARKNRTDRSSVYTPMSEGPVSGD